ALRPTGAPRRPAADALRAARVAVPEPALQPERQSAPPTVRSARGSAERPGWLPVRRDDVPVDGAPHGRRHVAVRAVPLRATARDVLRGASRAGARARARPRRLGDDPHLPG